MIGENIKNRRIQLNLTQGKLAELIGCSQSNISKYENEELQIDAMMIPEFAVALGCSIDDLYREPDNTGQKGA